MPALTLRGASNVHEATSTILSESSSVVEPSEGRVRLHITPFNPDLLPKILPPSLQEEASNISFHHTQVSPDKGFGYVELPIMAADKLKKKLNGSILKGEKIKVQDAKPEKRRKVDGEDDDVVEEEPSEVPERLQRKKRRIDEKVEDGVELPEGRRVKRGWTETVAEKKEKKNRTAEEKQARKEKKEKKREASKYTTEPEMLFKAKLEPTAVTSKALRGKGKSKDDKKEKKDKNKKTQNEATIHEFENTTKHAGFLKENQVTEDTPMTTEYVDGKGWVDTQGNIDDSGRKSTRKKAKKPGADLVPSIETSNVTDRLESDARPDSGIALPNQSTTAAQQSSIHPLEALFKRQKPSDAAPKSTATSPKKPPPIDTSKAAFSFFDADADAGSDDDNDGNAAPNRQSSLSLPPMTPITKRDFQMRGLRSAAPEPDTASHERHFSFADALDLIEEEEGADEIAANVAPGGAAEEEEEDDDDAHGMDVDDEEDGEGGEEKQPRQESEFRKWFYEHRGENNRAWRQKRREAMKVKRQRENRRLARRVVV